MKRLNQQPHCVKSKWGFAKAQSQQAVSACNHSLNEAQLQTFLYVSSILQDPCIHRRCKVTWVKAGKRLTPF